MKQIIVRLSEGIGNQLFMYANSYSLSKKFQYELLLDDTSGYFKNKNKIRRYELDKFNINNKIINNKFKFDTNLKDFQRKILKKIDFFRRKKKFLLENRDSNKNTYYQNIDISNLSNTFHVEGHYESENYFRNFYYDLYKLFKIKKDYIDIKNKYISELSSSNSVSICVRQNRFSEGKHKNYQKSEQFTKDTINYIFRSVELIKNKIDNPKFFIWSNDFNNLRNVFDNEKFTFIENNNNKSLNDFNLFSYCKHFIVGPTSFHWWGAWLNNNPEKICIRPLNINPSLNKDFWPKKWISV